MKTSPTLRRALEEAIEQHNGVLRPQLLRKHFHDDDYADRKLRQLESEDYIERVDVGKFVVQDTPYKRADDEGNASLEGFMRASER